MLRICPTDFANVMLVKYSIVSNRTKQDEKKATPLELMCYFSDYMESLGCKCVHSRGIFEERILKYVSDRDEVRSIVDFVGNVATINDLLSQIDSIKEVFSSNPSQSQNDLDGPIKICYSSYIGIFVRSFLACWNTLKFEEICNFHQEILNFMNDTNAFETKSMNLESVNEEPNQLTQAFDFILKKDFVSAEALIHQFYDSDMTAESAVHFSLVPTNKEEDIQKSLQQFSVLNQPQIPSSAKHQHSMIRLSMLLIEAKNFTRAYAAIEEALNIAHQRGDHSSVACALMLLYRLLSEHNQSSELLTIASGVLMRAIAKCGALKLNNQVTYGVLSLIRLKSSGLLQSSDSPISLRDQSSENFDEIDSTEMAVEEQVDTSIGDLWAYLLVSLQGETSLTCDVIAKMDTNNSDTRPSQKNLIDSPSVVSRDLVQFIADSVFLECDLWERLGMIGMAMWSCRKFLTLYSSITKVETQILVICKLIKLHIYHINIVERENDEKTNNCLSNIVKMCKKMRKLKLSIASPTVAIETEYQITRTYVGIYSSIFEDNWAKALVLSKKLVSLTTPIRNYSSIDDDISENENIRAKLLLAEILMKFNPLKAKILASELEDFCRFNNLPQWQYLAEVTGNIDSLARQEEWDSNLSGRALSLMNDVLKNAKKFNFGIVELVVNTHLKI